MKGLPGPNHPCINVLPSRTMENRVLRIERLNDRSPDKFLHRVKVLCAGEIAFLAACPLQARQSQWVWGMPRSNFWYLP